MFTLDELRYGGKYHSFFWGDLNPNATISNGLANCTTLTWGDCAIDGWQPVDRIVNANNWHKHADKVIPFDLSKVEVGDVLEWENKCHVAKVDDIYEGVPYLNCSWYTGIHGTAVYDGHFDTRPFSTLKELSDFMIDNYPTRFYHHWSLDQENRGVGDIPQWIIKRPTIIKSDGEDKSIDQIKVNTDEQNVRTEPNVNCEIVGIAESGFYNAYATIFDGKYNWYQIKNNLYIAGVNGRVEFIEGEDDIKKYKKAIERLTKRNSELLEAIEKAKKDLEV